MNTCITNLHLPVLTERWYRLHTSKWKYPRKIAATSGRGVVRTPVRSPVTISVTISALNDPPSTLTKLHRSFPVTNHGAVIDSGACSSVVCKNSSIKSLMNWRCRVSPKDLRPVNNTYSRITRIPTVLYVLWNFHFNSPLKAINTSYGSILTST